MTNANVHGASVHMNDPGAATLTEWMAGVRRWRLAAFAHGVDDPAGVLAANTVGFDYLSGKAV
jgi:hypothetical protein